MAIELVLRRIGIQLITVEPYAVAVRCEFEQPRFEMWISGTERNIRPSDHARLVWIGFVSHSLRVAM